MTMYLYYGVHSMCIELEDEWYSIGPQYFILKRVKTVGAQRYFSST